MRMISKLKTNAEGKQFLVIEAENLGDRAFMGLLGNDGDEVIGILVTALHPNAVSIPFEGQAALREGRITNLLMNTLTGQQEQMEDLRERCAVAAAQLAYGAQDPMLGGMILKAVRAIKLTEDEDGPQGEENSRQGPEQDDTGAKAAGADDTSAEGQSGRELEIFDVGFGKPNDKNQGPDNRVAGTGGPETEG